jgi:SAM-dependent methyltransferase
MDHPETKINMAAGVACPACGHSATSRLDWSGSWADRTFGLLKCLKCGSLTTFPPPDPEFLRRFYDTSFDYRWYSDHSTGKKADAAERATELADVMEGKVLDLGGGIGYLSRALAAKGITAVTHDPFAPGSQRPPASGELGTITCMHVLEHVSNPLQFLKNARDLLRPAGRIVLAVPNASGAGYSLQGMSWIWAQPPITHLHHFTPIGLLALLDRAGFQNPLVSFHDRWDANCRSDIECVRATRIIDALWGLPVLSAIPPWRKLAAWASARRRMMQLREARNAVVPDSDRAELHVVAEKAGEK